MAADAETGLLRLAAAVSDRLEVRWSDERAAAGERTAVIEGLEHLHALAAAFAAVDPPDGALGARPIARWGQLELVARLGEGSFGEVYRARDPNLGREVALKLHRAGPGSVGDSGRQLLEEARRLARIRHPNVVTVHGADLADGKVGIWTELIEGQTLEERLAEDGPLGPAETIALGLDLCRALAAVHASGLVHGDVKASNVLRERGGRIVLTDLGSSTEAGDSPRTGSPATLAPEVLAGGLATPVADLYSLGVLLFRMLSGSYPGDAGSLRDLRPDLPLELVCVIERAVDPEPERRYGSAGSLERALALTGGVATASSSPVPRRARRRGVAAALALAAAALTTMAVLVTANRSQPPPAAPPATDQQLPLDSEALESEIGPAIGPAIEPATEPVTAASASRRSVPVTVPLTVRATMFRDDEPQARPLASGSKVTPGDRLYLELRADESIHAWVVNEDLRGDLFVLFPIPGLDLGNPLPAGTLHRLPGRLAGVPQEWQVTSAGGRERFLVVASRNDLPELEQELAGLAAAHSEAAGVSRGVGGLAPAAGVGGGRLDALVERLDTIRQRDGSVWLERLELLNP